ncbi:head-tail adaptor protein [Tissierella pigra]|uniref:Head-tail adaptor protein n=1 Tax=Tissierella pigra TaxID=2607614 RepID=A0A6N7XVX0_9FIRM|nr:head-tail adaptor protein [Tissierella pigra]MSU01937.1 head-tail adaptor protein [Tissierella pigra]
MSYAEKFLKSKGQDCIINRPIPLHSKVSIKRSTKASRDLGIREGYWEGLILADSNLKSGETITIRDNKYLIQSTNYDHASMECAFFSAKCNATIQHKRYVEDVDENFNPIQEWQTINSDVACYGEIITSRMREVETGLEDNAVYIFQVPKTLGVALLDRFVHGGKNYEVVSIDDIGLEGVARVQLGMDNRPD